MHQFPRPKLLFEHHPNLHNGGQNLSEFELILRDISLGTIHLRRRHIFTIFNPYPLPSAFQQNANEGDF